MNLAIWWNIITLSISYANNPLLMEINTRIGKIHPSIILKLKKIQVYKKSVYYYTILYMNRMIPGIWSVVYFIRFCDGNFCIISCILFIFYFFFSYKSLIPTIFSMKNQTNDSCFSIPHKEKKKNINVKIFYNNFKYTGCIMHQLLSIEKKEQEKLYSR